MSTQAKKPVARPAKKPAAPKTEVKPVEEATSVPPVPPVAAEVPQATGVVAPAEPAEPKRVQANKIVGVSIASARTRRHLDKLNINAVVDGQIAELKALAEPHYSLIDKLKTAEGDEAKTLQAEIDKSTPEVAVIESKIAALSRERTRFSSEAATALSIVCNSLVSQLAQHTMDNAIAAKAKIIKVSHVHTEGVEKLSLYPLVSTLSLFVSTGDKLRKEFQDAYDESERNKLVKGLEKEFKAKYKITTPKKKAEGDTTTNAAAPTTPADPAPTVASESAPEVEPEDDGDSKTSFKFYVHQACKAVAMKEPEKYKSIRISTDIKDYFSDLVTEFIKRIAPLVAATANSVKTKTVSKDTIMRIIKNILIDGHVPVETVELEEGKFPDPVKVKEENAKKDAEKAAGRKYKVNLESLPKVNGYNAKRTVTYPTSGYAALESEVDEKLSLYHKLEAEDASQ